MRNDASVTKLERYRMIEKQIAAQFPSPVSIDKLVLWVKLNIGLTEARAREYICDVVAGKDWVMNPDDTITAEVKE